MADRLPVTTCAVGDIELFECVLGEGRPLLFLHSGEGPDVFSDAYLRLLARRFRVHAPWHPGFGPSLRPPHFRDVADLACFYLDYADACGFADAVLAGASFGGWIAAEMAVRGSERFSRLVLIDPFGIKAGDRETRDYLDMFAMPTADWHAAQFVEPGRFAHDLAEMSEEALSALMQSRESLAFYGWQPYLHDPRLGRWLHRVRMPALVLRGEEDRVVREDVHRAYAARIPDCRYRMIAGAGHHPHVERPEAVAEAIADFVDAAARPRAAAG